MRKEGHSPLLIVIAGPNGSGKNAARIARRVMKGGHDVPIPKIISRYIRSIANCAEIASVVDRLYVYDNSLENKKAVPLFRLRNGVLGKQYVDTLPEWAKNFFPC